MDSTTTAWARPAPGVHLTPESWLGRWERTNRTATMPHCIDQLEVHGALNNLRRVTGEHDGPRVGFLFSDSDVYKMLEAVGWEAQRAAERGRPLDTELRTFTVEAVALLSRAQREDGYLNSFCQTDGRVPWENMRWHHELYCLGHLAQAAVAWSQVDPEATEIAADAELLAARTELIALTRRFVDLVVRRWRAGEPIVCGHAEVESALVDLHRVLGSPEHLELAAAMVEARGHDTLGPDGFGAAYFQDHVPVRQAPEAAGHAVRQLYLLAGAADVAVETQDDQLLAAVVRLWESAHRAKAHVTGGMGSRHRDESFGDPYEVPPDRGYAETCAAIADWMLSWRLLLATGEARYGRAMDRALYNAIRAAVDEDGTRFFYSCPLQMRTHRTGVHEQAPSGRAAWYDCACCPPNLARLLASLRHAAAARTDDGALAVLMPVSAEIPVSAGGSSGVLTVEAGLPWSGTLRLRFTAETDADSGAGEERNADAGCPVPVQVRIPDGARVADGTGPADRAGLPDGAAVRDGWLHLPVGLTALEVEFELPVVVRRAHHRADALRGQRVITRGPVVYALESGDLPERVLAQGAELEDVELETSGGPEVHGEVLGAPAVVVPLRVRREARDDDAQDALYPPHGDAGQPGERFTAALVPFGLWGNRGDGAMRVWIPASDSR
ncbi:glycoside hydrolase family 127 protein [Nesterenkonia sp. CL21]|uniref:glycoside hydrolase family 127 protein n=1 Tax=Nesterenkonia sp. CL21 TaxID=3064894 RepID=UPI00287A07C1|nr:beta-L-arabinofuranosidase domain-containing protein [Nesterenkonia sp. CL21]MDS2172305.1 glycoside hydrolase family 127 protein [Nesterenkonia sp. CL21]